MTRLVAAQAVRGTASLVLTGGAIGTAVLRALRSSPARAAVDWTAVDVWWGDERWVPADDADRNETQARTALLDVVDLDPARVHAIPASDAGPAAERTDAAAARYAAELAAAGPAVGGAPRSTCCCSAWARRGTSPRSSRSRRPLTTSGTVVAVRGLPEAAAHPGQPGLLDDHRRPRRSGCWSPARPRRRRWRARCPAPAGSSCRPPGRSGTVQTRWLLDEAAAAQLPRDLRRR